MSENLLTTSQSQPKHLMIIFEGPGDEMVKLWAEHEKNPHKVFVSFGPVKDLDFDKVREAYKGT